MKIRIIDPARRSFLDDPSITLRTKIEKIEKEYRDGNAGIVFLINIEKRVVNWGTEKERKEIGAHGLLPKQQFM